MKPRGEVMKSAVDATLLLGPTSKTNECKNNHALRH